MSNVLTVPAKYIFLDVVGFTHNRTVDAQSDIVEALNRVVSNSLAFNQIAKENVVLLPTGDGICICLLNVENPFDIHMQVALQILSEISKYNEATLDAKRQFQVRIGINANVDNLVIDINGLNNLAGSGINMAARIMNVADGNQILVSQGIYDTLGVRDQYHNTFVRHSVKVKHGLELPVYQYVGDLNNSLNRGIPTTVLDSVAKTPRITQRTFFYMVLCERSRGLFESINVIIPEAPYLVVSAWMMATELRDALHNQHRQPHKALLNDFLKSNIDFKAKYKFYKKQDFHLVWEMAELCFRELLPYRELFERGTGHWFLYLNELGRNTLRTEIPDIDELLISDPHTDDADKLTTSN